MAVIHAFQMIMETKGRLTLRQMKEQKQSVAGLGREHSEVCTSLKYMSCASLPTALCVHFDVRSFFPSRRNNPRKARSLLAR